MLQFLGIGGAFFPDLGNTSAFYRKGNELFLLDCGEDVFGNILKNHLLEGIAKINILITHFHSDHVGSLGTLVFYCEAKNLNEINIIFPNKEKLAELIRLFGIQNCNINIYTPKEFARLKIKEYRQEHDVIEAYGYIIELDRKIIYYSGDTKSIPDEVFNLLLKGKIDYFFQDVRLKQNPYHLSLDELESKIPFNLRKQINCMHFVSEAEIAEVTKHGFSRVRRLESEGKNGNIKSGK